MQIREGRRNLTDIEEFVARAAGHLSAQLGDRVVEIYRLGSLAHGGFSRLYSDIDVGVLLDGSAPPGLDLKPIDMALACRREKCAAEEVFGLRPDLVRQCESAFRYISTSRG